jgi:hypothetical protein
MGFITEFAAIQAAKIRAGLRRSPGPRIDGGLPYGLKIGARVLFEDTPFILAEGVGHQVKKPDVQAVAAYGRMGMRPSGRPGGAEFFAGYVLHRFYLEDGVNVIQAVTNPRGEHVPGELRLYRLVREWFPQNLSEWSIWVSTNDDPDDRYCIGFNRFDLPEAADTARIAYSYARMWPSSQEAAEQVSGVEFSETLNADPYGGDTAEVKHQVMLYGRVPERPGTFPESVPIPDEWMLLAMSEYPDSAVVQAHAGLAIVESDFIVAQPSA